MVKPAKGTTTLAFIFKEGIIVAAESRTSMGGYVGNHEAFECVFFLSSVALHVLVNVMLFK